MKKYQFSRMLTKPEEYGPVRRYLQAATEMQDRHDRDRAELEKLHKKSLEEMADLVKFPRSLTIIVDPSHIDEHGVVFVQSRETEDVEDQRQETLH